MDTERNPRILVIEDDVSISELICMDLEAAGCLPGPMKACIWSMMKRAWWSLNEITPYASYLQGS